MSDPLADLKDIHLPDPVSWWPPAPGWWALVVLTILLVLLIIFGYKQWQKNAYRRLALKELNDIATNMNETDAGHYLDTIAELIRRTALAAPVNQPIAHWQGTKWLEYLQQHMPEEQAHTIAIDRYQPLIDIDKEKLTNATRQWIKGHKS